ncbi:hypothetical protein ARMGADRAFT_1092589 [Armillaria gallica]|uniref:Uncharacterized protein n=1 Tax=Armillaria gallica TaxID=47427 RepID=A0A2H3CTG5_ARMGA|nr:hypothetical protein ARMGADRAFT_1092589 [Armillaria gallica]
MPTRLFLPIGSDSGSTVTDIDINACPLLPESPFTSSTDLYFPDDENNLAYAVGYAQIPPSPTISPQPWSPPLSPLLSNFRPDVFHPEDVVPFPDPESEPRPGEAPLRTRFFTSMHSHNSHTDRGG